MTRTIVFLALITLCFVGCGASIASSEAVTLQRVDELPLVDQIAWKEYLKRSEFSAQADAAALKSELTDLGMTQAIRAPDGGDFKLPAKPGDAWYAQEEASKLVEIVLSYQTPSGGWSKHTGYSAGPRKPGMQWTSQNAPGQSPHYVATFDNRSTTEQLHYLANVWEATKRDDCKAGFIKGLNYILVAQFPNGGWPQVYPLEGGYHDNITFNDDAMTHVLELLHAIEQEEPRFAFLDTVQRQQAADSLARGIHCVLKAQVILDGKKTVWCAQHDALTLQPARARQIEPPTLSGLEGSRVLRFLMSVPEPSPELVESIEGGLSWLESAKVTGLTRGKQNGKTAYLEDSSSSEVYWARFYDLTTGKPVFPGRDGILYASFTEMAVDNPLGYDFYTPLPGSILNNGQKKWRKMLASQARK